MRLIEHVGGIEARRAARARVDEFVEHAEETERVDRASVQIVVAVFEIVEVESGEFSRADEPRDDLLDVDVGRMVAEVDEERLVNM